MGIYWLASYPKSGNTWLRAFINNLMAIRAGRPATGAAELNRATLTESNADHFAGFLTPADMGDINKVSRARPAVHDALAKRYPADIFVKTHSAFGIFDGVPTIAPGATIGAVYIVRDPRDVAISMTTHYGVSVDEAIRMLADERLFTGAAYGGAATFMSSWSAHVASWTRSREFRPLVLRYEDMLANATAAFAAFAKHAGLAATPEMIAAAVHASRFEALAADELSGRFAESPETATGKFFRAGRAGQWRKELSAAQVRRIEVDHGRMMGALGYPKTADHSSDSSLI